jgi:hypothetical protein
MYTHRFSLLKLSLEASKSYTVSLLVLLYHMRVTSVSNGYARNGRQACLVPFQVFSGRARARVPFTVYSSSERSKTKEQFNRVRQFFSNFNCCTR